MFASIGFVMAQLQLGTTCIQKTGDAFPKKTVF